jgi:hypothetical protein
MSAPVLRGLCDNYVARGVGAYPHFCRCGIEEYVHGLYSPDPNWETRGDDRQRELEAKRLLKPCRLVDERGDADAGETPKNDIANGN